MLSITLQVSLHIAVHAWQYCVGDTFWSHNQNKGHVFEDDVSNATIVAQRKQRVNKIMLTKCFFSCSKSAFCLRKECLFFFFFFLTKNVLCFLGRVLFFSKVHYDPWDSFHNDPIIAVCIHVYRFVMIRIDNRET